MLTVWPQALSYMFLYQGPSQAHSPASQAQQAHKGIMDPLLRARRTSDRSVTLSEGAVFDSKDRSWRQIWTPGWVALVHDPALLHAPQAQSSDTGSFSWSGLRRGGD